MSELHESAGAGAYVAAHAAGADKARAVLAAHGLSGTISFPYKTRIDSTQRLS
jgi:hypothetical protein